MNAVTDVDLRTDEDRGWIFHDGEPRWRATRAAVARMEGMQLRWLMARNARVLHMLSGVPVATLRNVPAHRRWIARIEGFSFWSENRIMGREMFVDPMGFDRIDQAPRFIETVVRQAGATIVV